MHACLHANTHTHTHTQTHTDANIGMDADIDTDIHKHTTFVYSMYIAACLYLPACEKDIGIIELDTDIDTDIERQRKRCRDTYIRSYIHLHTNMGSPCPRETASQAATVVAALRSTARTAALDLKVRILKGLGLRVTGNLWRFEAHVILPQCTG